MILSKADEASSVESLRAAYRQRRHILDTQRLEFVGVEGFDVYNICQPFEYEGDVILPGRVEKRDSEVSEVWLFRKVHNSVYAPTKWRFPNLQDPFITHVGDRIVIGGTHIEHQNGIISTWCTRVFAGRTLDSLQHLFDAPSKMKDVRLIEHKGIHLFTRPQGGPAGRGKIGHVRVDALDAVNRSIIDDAPLLTTQFTDDSWGGVNQVHVLANGLLGIVGHIAIMSVGDVRHYYGMVFAYDPISRDTTPVKIICERADFGIQEAKRPDLEDVVFTGGLCRHPNGTATLYAGVSDAGAHTLHIPDPLLSYERQ